MFYRHTPTRMQERHNTGHSRTLVAPQSIDEWTRQVPQTRTVKLVPPWNYCIPATYSLMRFPSPSSGNVMESPPHAGPRDSSVKNQLQINTHGPGLLFPFHFKHMQQNRQLILPRERV